MHLFVQALNPKKSKASFSNSCPTGDWICCPNQILLRQSPPDDCDRISFTFGWVGSLCCGLSFFNRLVFQHSRPVDSSESIEWSVSLFDQQLRYGTDTAELKAFYKTGFQESYSYFVQFSIDIQAFLILFQLNLQRQLQHRHVEFSLKIHHEKRKSRSTIDFSIGSGTKRSWETDEDFIW